MSVLNTTKKIEKLVGYSQFSFSKNVRVGMGILQSGVLARAYANTSISRSEVYGHPHQ